MNCKAIASILVLVFVPEFGLNSLLLGQAKRGDIFHPPVRLAADGQPIDLGKLASQGHAGPCFEDIDGDGAKDLLVGAFPGNFWFFKNKSSDSSTPEFNLVGKLQAGGEDAEAPIY